jgi:hypothetical protein
VTRVLTGKARTRGVTLAEARLGDGQRLLGMNDLFIGARSHVSARYALEVGDRREVQSSSGVLVATGAGSTGWLSSMFAMASGLAAFTGGSVGAAPRLGWDDPRLAYVVREPFASKSSQATIVAGLLAAGASLTIESHMPDGGRDLLRRRRARRPRLQRRRDRDRRRRRAPDAHRRSLTWRQKPARCRESVHRGANRTRSSSRDSTSSSRGSGDGRPRSLGSPS